MTTIKLTTNKALQSAHAAQYAKERLILLANDERLARITVHSHGAAIQEAIDHLESALELAKQFQFTVQGR